MSNSFVSSVSIEAHVANVHQRIRRKFVAIDEWLGVAVLLYLRHQNDMWFFWRFLIPWAVMVYGIGYPTHWYQTWKERKRHG